MGEDGADGGGDHFGRALGDLGEQVAEEVEAVRNQVVGVSRLAVAAVRSSVAVR